MLAAGEHDVPQQSAVGVLVVAGRVRVKPDGCARESPGGVVGRFGAVGFHALRRVLRLGRVHAGQPNGVAIPIKPYGDGVAVDHAVNLGGSGLCVGWRAGQPREDREGHDPRWDVARSHACTLSSRSICHVLLPAS